MTLPYVEDDWEDEDFLTGKASSTPFTFKTLDDWWGKGLERDLAYIERISKEDENDK